jgi:hypothetical protein
MKKTISEFHLGVQHNWIPKLIEKLQKRKITNAKTLNKVLANQIQEYVKMIIYHKNWVYSQNASLVQC